MPQLTWEINTDKYGRHVQEVMASGEMCWLTFATKERINQLGCVYKLDVIKNVHGMRLSPKSGLTYIYEHTNPPN
jgi:hypothetical protein